MKRGLILLGVTTAIAFLAIPALDARDGGSRSGGGARGGSAARGGGKEARGGGGGRGGQAHPVQRSPSMSRTGQNRSNNQSAPSRKNERPGQVQSQSNRKPTQNNLKEFLHTHPQSSNRPAGTHIHTNRQNLGKNVRNNVHTHNPHHHDWFNDHFWVNHHHFPAYYHSHHNWWRWTTPVAVGGWLGWNAAPIYYDFYADNGATYWGPSTVVVQNPVYVQQPASPLADESTDEWMPLGVFGLTKENSALSEPNIYLQLALNKNGEVAGSYYNSITDEGYEITGVIDQQTQTVAMKVLDDPNAPIIESGIYNLTQAEAPVRVHFIDGRIENMLLIRIDDPK